MAAPLLPRKRLHDTTICNRPGRASRPARPRRNLQTLILDYYEFRLLPARNLHCLPQRLLGRFEAKTNRSRTSDTLKNQEHFLRRFFLFAWGPLARQRPFHVPADSKFLRGHPKPEELKHERAPHHHAL